MKKYKLLLLATISLKFSLVNSQNVCLAPPKDYTGGNYWGAITDIDNDGSKELIRTEDDLVIYKSDSNSKFFENQRIKTTFGRAITDDFNGDGLIDFCQAGFSIFKYSSSNQTANSILHQQ